MMLFPDDARQATEAAQDTDALAVLPRIVDHRSVLTERRQQILQQKSADHQTDALPKIAVEAIPPKTILRQVIQLREENYHLRSHLEEVQQAYDRLMAAYNELQGEFDGDVATIHHGYRQELVQYHRQLQAALEERDRLQDQYHELEVQYQDLFHSFHTAVEEEAYKMVTQAAQILDQTPDQAPVLLHDVVRSLELRAQQLEDKHLVETLYLKREVQQLADVLQQERQQVERERQQLVIMQYSISEQAVLRRKVLQARLHMRWKISFVAAASGLLVLLLALQYVFLLWFHIPISGFVSLALIAPLVLCALLSMLLAHPLSMLRHIYLSAPRKQKAKKA